MKQRQKKKKAIKTLPKNVYHLLLFTLLNYSTPGLCKIDALFTNQSGMTFRYHVNQHLESYLLSLSAV